MDTTALPELAADLLAEARGSSARRAARTLCGGSGHTLRQTAIAVAEGASLSDHESPGEATLQVLEGRVRLTWPDGSLDLEAGDYVLIPGQRHGVLALSDAVVLLTTAMT